MAKYQCSDENCDMEVIVSGTKDSIVMVEGESDFISEEDFLSSIQYRATSLWDRADRTLQKSRVAVNAPTRQADRQSWGQKRRWYLLLG